MFNDSFSTLSNLQQFDFDPRLGPAHWFKTQLFHRDVVCVPSSSQRSSLIALQLYQGSNIQGSMQVVRSGLEWQDYAVSGKRAVLSSQSERLQFVRSASLAGRQRHLWRGFPRHRRAQLLPAGDV